MVLTGTHSILANGYGALLGLTMMELAATAREPSWTQTYGTVAEQGIKTLHIADVESRMQDNEVIFGGSYEGA